MQPITEHHPESLQHRAATTCSSSFTASADVASPSNWECKCSVQAWLCFNERCQLLPPHLRALGRQWDTVTEPAPAQLSLSASPNQLQELPGLSLPFRGAQPRELLCLHTEQCQPGNCHFHLNFTPEAARRARDVHPRSPRTCPVPPARAGPQRDSWAHPLPEEPGQRVQPLILPAAAIISCNEEDPSTGTFQKDLMFYDRKSLIWCVGRYLEIKCVLVPGRLRQ